MPRPRILITSGPTRQYLDPVRYLTNASSGRMGKSLVDAALEYGCDVTLITGPVEIEYSTGIDRVDVVSTEEMFQQAHQHFPDCQGAIGVAAPCDYRPVRVSDQKIAKTGAPLTLNLVETPDVVASLGARKRTDQWVVGFALETEDHRFRAIRKLEEKCCDLIVLNSPEAMHASRTSVEVIAPDGEVVCSASGSKDEVARSIFDVIHRRLLK